MNRFLLGALAMGAFVLTSFAVRAAADPAVKKNGPAWRVSDYQMDRAFRVHPVLNQGSPSITGQVPPTGGFIITEIRSSTGGLTISVNGLAEQFSFGNPNGQPDQVSFNPPIIVRPNDVITLSTGNNLNDLVIAGYTTLPGET